ncbi:hypothetical protein HY522_11035 [bacterium]|nr:hypothetical protein [bacterium]
MKTDHTRPVGIWMYALTVSAALAFTLVAAPAVFAADDTNLTTAGITKPAPGGMGLTLSVANGVSVTTPTQAGASYFNVNKVTDSTFALSTPVNPIIRRVDTIYSDTITLAGENAGANPTTDTTRKVKIGDTAVYVLMLANLGNVSDSIGIVIDSATVADSRGVDTMFSWSIHVRDSSNAFLGIVRTRGLDTFFVKLAAFRAETFSLRAVADSRAAETSWINFRVRTYVGGGNPARFAVQAYRGFNGDTYGGDGHDSITLFAQLEAPSRLRVSKADTVFSPVSLGRGTSLTLGDDTQHYIPGAIVVHTIWFDNDDTGTVDTVVIEDWIDTRAALFDSAGLSFPAGANPQNAAAGTYVLNAYGNIFVDSAMPTNAAGGAFNVRIEYRTDTATPGWAALTPSVARAKVGRIRWTISQSGSAAPLVAGNNGDGEVSIDPAPLSIRAAADSDMGYVRYAVVLRSDSVPAGPGWPRNGQSYGANPTLIGADSAFIEPDGLAAARVEFVGPFTAEYLPKVSVDPETKVAKKIHQASGDTFYFAHNLGNHGNGFDSIALTGTATVAGVTVTFFKDIGGIGVPDGDPRIDSVIALGEVETVPILVAVFVPGTYTGSGEAHFKAFSTRNVAFSETGIDFFTIIGAGAVIVDSPTVVGSKDTSLSFTVSLNVPCTEDTVIITIDTAGGGSSGAVDSAMIVFDTNCVATILTVGETFTYNDTTGVLTVTFLTIPPSDTFVWTIVALDVDSGVIDTTFLDTGSFVVDTIPPFFTNTNIEALLFVDTTLSPSETAVGIQLFDTAIGDTNTGIDSVVITIRDTAGNIIVIDTVDAKIFYQFPFDTPGGYTIELVAIDIAGNTVALEDSLVIVIPIKRTIDLVATDANGVVQLDDVARGLRAQGCVTVTDPAANTNPASKQAIMVTVGSDVDPIGIELELFETDVNTGVFTECFGFTNGVSNTAAKKLKVQDGSIITALYDSDGTGPESSISDQITWEGILVQTLDGVRTWPNPFNSLTDAEIVFHNLPPDPNMTIEIYNMNAEKLVTLRVGQGISFSANENIGRWNGRNSRGQLVASATYVYLVRSNLGTKVGKFTMVH